MMTSNPQQFKAATDNTTAMTQNVAQAMEALDRAMHRPVHLPGLVGFYGPSGYGKSVAAAYTATDKNALYLECRDSWTRKSFLLALLKEMGIKPEATIAEMMDQASQELALSERPLIIDEVDKPIDKNYIELIRDLHEGAGGVAMLLIGEEKLELKLRRFERVHNRVLEWLPALPADIEDTRLLAGLYCPDLEITDELLQLVLQTTLGVTRRIAINLSRIGTLADLHPPEGPATPQWWGDREIYTE